MSPAAAPPPAGVPARCDRVAAWLAQRQLDALLVTAPANVRYLTGFTGSSAVALLGSADLLTRLFLTDFRYVTQAAAQLDSSFERVAASAELLDDLAPRLSPGAYGRSWLRVGFDDTHLSVKAHGRLTAKLPAGVELVSAGGLVERLRAVKDTGEVARIRAAAALADEVLGWVLDRGLVGRTEPDVATTLEHELRVRGASAPSFPSIVAAGEHSALPHAEPRDVRIGSDTLVTVDMGALLDGYCSDCTRTFATGNPGDQARDVYNLVLRAQQAGLDAIRPGPTGREIDAVARAVIAEHGHGEHFGHGLGHGVGLEIHEGPRLSRTAGEQALEAGNVVTVEPGVYLPGRFGVRIEDLVLVTAEACDVLSGFSKELIVAG